MRRFINVATATGRLEDTRLSYVSNAVVTEFRRKIEKRCKSVTEKIIIPDIMCLKRCFLYHGKSKYLYFGRPLIQAGCALEICYLNTDNEEKTVTKNVNVIFSELPECFNPNGFKVLLPNPVRAVQDFRNINVNFDIILELS